MKLNEKELLEDLNQRNDQSLVNFDTTQSINYKPHPYCIGGKHLEYNTSIYLGKEQIEQMEKEHGPMCCMYTDAPDATISTKYHNKKTKDCKFKCNLTYEQHTSTKVIMVMCFKDLRKIEGFKLDIEGLEETLEQLNIEGFTFVDCFSNQEV